MHKLAQTCPSIVRVRSLKIVTYKACGWKTTIVWELVLYDCHFKQSMVCRVLVTIAIYKEKRNMVLKS